MAAVFFCVMNVKDKRHCCLHWDHSQTLGLGSGASHSGLIHQRMPPLASATFGFFPPVCFPVSEGMQRCHWSVPASCLWHFSLFKSPLKHRPALCPPQRVRGVGYIGLCFRLAPAAPRALLSPRSWSTSLMVPRLPFGVFNDFCKPLAAHRRQC